MTTEAAQIEEHEATAWAACIAAAGRVGGNPLDAEVGEIAGTPVSSLKAVGYWLFNRVIALGVREPASAPDVSAVLDWYAERGQSDFVVETSPGVRQPDLVELLCARGLVERTYKQAKVQRRATPVDTPPGIEVRELTTSHREAFAGVNGVAWQTPGALVPWFGLPSAPRASGTTASSMPVNWCRQAACSCQTTSHGVRSAQPCPRTGGRAFRPPPLRDASTMPPMPDARSFTPRRRVDRTMHPCTT